MNKNNHKLKFSVIYLILFILSIFSIKTIAAEKLVFTTVDGAYPQQVSEAVLKSAYAKLGIEFETSWLPPKRALVMASSGQSDGEISRIGAIAKKYPELIKIKIPVNYVEGMAISKKKSLPVNSWESLRPYKIGINRGIIFTVNGTRGMNVEFVNSFPSLFQMLEKDRVDVIVSPRLIALSLIQKQDLDDLVINEPPVTRLNQYHYLHKRHSSLAIRIEAVLNKMKESGEIDRVRATFIQELKQGIIHKQGQ